MPLIIITGTPCTGKTTVANLLAEFMKRQDNVKHVELVNEESLHISKAEGYKSSFDEKNTRGSLKSAADTLMNADSFLIVDSLNYIKGYRYQLYCSARTFRASHCTVWVACADQRADNWNKQRIESGGDAYEPAIMDELRRRYEAPNEQNRWDCPLFKICPCTDSTQQDPPSVLPPLPPPITAVTDSDDAATAVATAVRTVAGITDTSSSSSTSSSAINTNVAEGGVSSGTGNISRNTAQPTAVVKSSFKKSSWKPKKPANQTIGTGIGTDAAVDVIGGGSEAQMTEDPSNTSATATLNISSSTAQPVSFSGTVITAADKHRQLADFEAPTEEVFQRIYSYLIGAVVPMPNSSTLTAQRGTADLLYELDRTSQQILQRILTHQSDSAVEGTPVQFREYERALTLHRHAGVAELQRYRRQYVQMNGRNPPNSSKAIGTAFIDFLASQL